jgi:uncharacterized Zn-binding protein involved in type VI secretion
MPAVVRDGDECSGHDSFPPRANVEASGNVFVNGKGAHRVGDAWPSHCSEEGCHDAKQATGSGTVRVNGRPLARIGDEVSCGSLNAQGSPNVFAG